MPHQAKAGGIGVGEVGMQIATAQQFAFVKTPFGVDFGFVVGKRLKLGVRQKFELGNTNAVLA